MPVTPPASSSGGGGTVIFQDEGSAVGTATILNFVGAGVEATHSGGTVTATISGGTAAGSIVVLDEGTVAGTATALDVRGTGGTAAFSGGTATLNIWSPPRITDLTSAYEASSTSTAVTTAAYAVGATLIAIVYSTGRGANSITQTNVTWTQRYTGNGGSQYLELWTGVVAGSPSGTTATVAFTGANKNFIEIFQLPDVSAITSATLNGSSATATATLTTLTSGTLTLGSLVFWGVSSNSPSSSYSGGSHQYTPTGLYGGAGRGGVFYASSNSVGVWSLASSSVAYFGGFLVLA